MKAFRIAINGYGRIGRSVLRALYECDYRQQLQIVAINEPADLATIAHLTKYDSTHGRFAATIDTAKENLIVNGDTIAITHHETLQDLDWDGIDLVIDCSGEYALKAELELHLLHGAQRVLLSQPGELPIKAIVYGINHAAISAQDRILSTASCTTNAIVPVIKVLDDAFGIEHGIINTIHSAMNDQPVLDGYHHSDLRKTRASSASIIPINTALAAGIGRILPALDGRFSAHALRVPTLNVSAMEMTVQVSKTVTIEAVNAALQRAATGELRDVLGYTVEPLASCDFNHEPQSAIVDASQTGVSGQLVNVLIWFDNEWAYARRMLDVARYWLDAKDV
jgi:glyceraldehyde-3-phosphate dehydrogenase type I